MGRVDRHNGHPLIFPSYGSGDFWAIARTRGGSTRAQTPLVRSPMYSTSSASLLKSRTGWSLVVANALSSWRLAISSCTCVIRADSGAVTAARRFGGMRQARTFRNFILYPQRLAECGLGRNDILDAIDGFVARIFQSCRIADRRAPDSPRQSRPTPTYRTAPRLYASADDLLLRIQRPGPARSQTRTRAANDFSERE